MKYYFFRKATLCLMGYVSRLNWRFLTTGKPHEMTKVHIQYKKKVVWNSERKSKGAIF